MAQHPTPVFILGSGRSGTTVTASLLNHLPGVQIAKETGFIATNQKVLLEAADRQSLVRLIPEINSWLARNEWVNRASAEGFYQFCDRYNLQGGSALIHYVWQLDSETPWHELSFIGDNTPLYVMAIPTLEAMMPNARFIHMIRDPRDVVCSILKMRFGADEAVTAAMEWHIYFGCWLMAERLIPPDRRRELRYEDLCGNPGQAFHMLAEFLGRSEADAEAALSMHASGGGKAKDGFENVAKWSHHTRIHEPLSTSRIGRYTSELTKKQIQDIEEIAQYGMTACGYQSSELRLHPLIREDRFKLLKAMIRDFANRCGKRLRGR